MFAAFLLRLSRFSGRRPNPRRTGKHLPRFVPQLTPLEDRTLPSTFTVLNLNDSGTGSLRAAIAAANTNPGPDTIAFSQGLHGTITLTSGELLITGSVTVNGPGADRLSVSGNNASRVFELATGLNVTLSGLTITHGRALDAAGGILNNGSNLTLSGDNLAQNVAYEGATDSNGAQGGGLYSAGGILNISACAIAGNQALGGTDAAASGQAYGGGFLLAGGRATIQGSTFSGNLAQGGANSNYGAAAGGAINTGGPTYLDSVPVTITNCVFSDNQSATAASAPGNASTGGAISTGSGAISISGSTFERNQSIGGNGGINPFAGEAEGGAIANYCPLTISQSTFDQNLARAGSGGQGDPGAVDVDPSVDVAYGGAIFNLYGPATDFLDSSLNVSGTTFSGNEAIGGNNATATGTDIVEAGTAEGGALGMEIGVAATITGCTFDHNQAIGGSGNTTSGPVIDNGTGFGGAILSGWGGQALGATTLTVSNSTFSHNNATGGDNNTGTGTVAGFVGAGVGAGIANYLGGTASISGSDLDHGQARGGRGNTASGTGVFAGLGAGGGIFNAVGNYNSSGYGQFNRSVLTVTGSTIDHNQAQGGGGDNGAGGGIANLLSATARVDTSALTNNQANGDGGGAGLGGGAFNDASSSLTLTDSSVTQNHANGSPGIGGGVYTLGSFSFDALTSIADNHASTNDDNIGP
jgi:hypothetical protein